MNTIRWLLAAAVGVTAVGVRAQTFSAADSKAGVKAALVLTPEFCESKTKKGSFMSGKETFEIGKSACVELEPALKATFPGLTRVSGTPAAAGAQMVLTPRFVDVDATKTVGAFSNRSMIVLIEWTVKDAAGKQIWVETVQGSAKHHMGNMMTYKKNLKLIVKDSVKDAAEQSAKRMAEAPELKRTGT